MRYLILVLAFAAIGCGKTDKEPVPEVPPVIEEIVEGTGEYVNTCPNYSVMWLDACPDGERCIEFKNSCQSVVALAYQVGCNSDGSKGAPQCDCTDGPVLKSGESSFWKVVDGNYKPGDPSWEPPCLTEGLAVMAYPATASCTEGTRVEFSAGNAGDMYGKFDSYNLSTQDGQWYAVPVTFKPDLDCAVDHAAHNCRQVWCNAKDCPDAYATPTTGGCADGRPPQVGCQDTFNQSKGFLVEFCPADCATTGGKCPSCQDAKPCG